MIRIVTFTILFLVLLLNKNYEGLSQSNEERDFSFTGIHKPYLLSNHPLGMLISRIDYNFSIQPPKKIQINIGIHNGNVWQPLVKAYKPREPLTRAYMEKFIWYDREANFDLQTMPSDSIQYHADAVIRAFPADLRFRLADHHEINFRIRSFLITPGKMPFSTFTSDQLLEWFHSNIAGGEDPFARKYYGYNKADITYIDEHGESIKLKAGNFLIPGMELHYYYYPDINLTGIKEFYMNFGTHAGANISRHNRSVDLGLSASALKKISLYDHQNLIFGFGLGFLKQGVLKYGDHVHIMNNHFLYSFEGEITFRKWINEDSHYSFGLNYHYQNPYNRKEEFKYIVLTGNRVTTHWHYAMTHLYTSLQSWSLIFSYSGKRTFLVYFSEDLKVNNAPDIQTGIEIRIPLKEWNLESPPKSKKIWECH